MWDDVGGVIFCVCVLVFGWVGLSCFQVDGLCLCFVYGVVRKTLCGVCTLCAKC